MNNVLTSGRIEMINLFFWQLLLVCQEVGQLLTVRLYFVAL